MLRSENRLRAGIIRAVEVTEFVATKDTRLNRVCGGKSDESVAVTRIFSLGRRKHI